MEVGYEIPQNFSSGGDHWHAFLYDLMPHHFFKAVLFLIQLDESSMDSMSGQTCVLTTIRSIHVNIQDRFTLTLWSMTRLLFSYSLMSSGRQDFFIISGNTVYLKSSTTYYKLILSNLLDYLIQHSSVWKFLETLSQSLQLLKFALLAAHHD